MGSFWNWAIALFFEQKISNLENCSFFAHFCSFALSLFLKDRKSERAITLFITLFERAKEQSLFLSLFLKEQKNDCSFGRSFEKSKKRAIAMHSLKKFKYDKEHDTKVYDKMENDKKDDGKKRHNIIFLLWDRHQILLLHIYFTIYTTWYVVKRFQWSKLADKYMISLFHILYILM